MPSPIPDAAYVHRFNVRLAELNSLARVALKRLDGQGASHFQHRFAQREAPPIRVAELLWHIAETSLGAA